MSERPTTPVPGATPGETRVEPPAGLPLTGRCGCGGVAIEARETPKWVGLCHCASCRRATGAVAVLAAGFACEHVELRGPTLARYASSPGVSRWFCAVCGTSLAYQSERWPEDIHVMVGALDRPERLPPQFHIFFDERLGWLRIADDLPRYRRTPGERLLADTVEPGDERS